MTKVKIASVQYPITEHKSLEDWQLHTEKWVKEAVRQGAQLLLFPEYGSMELVSLFESDIRQSIHLQIKALEDTKDVFHQTFENLAINLGVTIVAPSLPVAEQNRTVNRAFVFSKNGLAGYQDKFFMTRFEAEEWNIESGPKVLTLFEADWGSFGIQICYDIEFPVGSSLLAEAGANLILAPSCTETVRGATRVHIGARARAMENQLYTVVSQTVGDAVWSPAVDINYGFAAFYSTPDRYLPEEGIINTGTAQEEKWLYADLDLSLLKTVREGGQVFNFKDSGELSIGLKNTAIKINRIRL